MFETLQIKRITNKESYDKHANDILENGEPLLIDININSQGMNIQSPIFLFGNGINTIQQLISSRDLFVNMVAVDSMIQKYWPTTPPPSINHDGRPSSAGDSPRFARENHYHELSKVAVENILGRSANLTTQFNCRRIKAGTADPTTTNVGGDPGDIYIRYEE